MLFHFPAVPDGPPLSIQATADIVFSINITWSPPDLALQNGLITNYTLLHTTDPSQPLNQRPSVTLNAATLSHKLTSLLADTRYYISVAAANSVGFGPFGNTSAITLRSRKSRTTE